MTATYEIPRDVQAAGEDCVLFFLHLVEDKGNDPAGRLTETLAMRSFPAIMTDDVAINSLPTISQMFDRDPENTSRLCKMAMSKGYKPKPTDCYLSSVAAEQGDPAAFVNHGQGLGSLRKSLDKRGYNTRRGDDGTMLTVEPREADSDPYETPKYNLNPKIVERRRKHLLSQNPDLKAKSQTAIRESIVDKHGKK